MGNYLTDRRIALGLTQKEVARQVGVSEATVCRWETGAIANMRRDRITKLAQALHTTPEFIMTGREPVAHDTVREILAGEGIRIQLDADSKLTEEQLADIVRFIRFRQQENDR